MKLQFGLCEFFDLGDVPRARQATNGTGIEKTSAAGFFNCSSGPPGVLLLAKKW
jgi:hypothetical protein